MNVTKRKQCCCIIRFIFKTIIFSFLTTSLENPITFSSFTHAALRNRNPLWKLPVFYDYFFHFLHSSRLIFFHNNRFIPFIFLQRKILLLFFFLLYGNNTLEIANNDIELIGIQLHHHNSVHASSFSQILPRVVPDPL